MDTRTTAAGPPRVRDAYYKTLEHKLGGYGDLLGDLGASIEIARALMDHSRCHAPYPGFRRDEIHERLIVGGWASGVSVSAFRDVGGASGAKNCYELFKSFTSRGKIASVAVELDRGEIRSQLLKLRRGIVGKQIAAGAVILKERSHLERAVTEHRLPESLRADLVISLVTPIGPGLS